jgi:hypothetical protein
VTDSGNDSRKKMLARLLRFAILMLVLAGLGISYMLHSHGHMPLWSLLAGATLMPIVCVLIVLGIAAIQSNAGESRRAWWQSLLGENMAGIRLFLLKQPWTTATPAVLPATAATERQVVPVVLVHGFLCNHRLWDDVEGPLRAQGHNVLAVNLEPVFASIDHYVAIIDAAVTELCQRTGVNQVALVGHSMGGLAIRAWIRAQGSQRVARVVTLGTPHVGTQAKPNGQTRNGRQMGWQSLWLKEFDASETQAIRSLFRIAITAQDEIVFPQRLQTMPGVTAMVFEGIGHLQMCLNPSVIAWLATQLAGLEVDAQPALGAAVCDR